MRRLSLGTLLIAVNVGLVLLAALGVVVVAAGLLRRYADDQTLERASRAGAGAVQAIERTARDLAESARLLAERPEIGRSALAGDHRELQKSLAALGRTMRLSACAILTHGRPEATYGAVLPWDRILPSPGSAAGSSLVPDTVTGSLLLAASASVPGEAGTSVVVALRLDGAYAETLGREVGLPVAILDLPAALEGSAERVPARGRAVDSERPISERLESSGVYLAVQPLRASTGEVIGIVETELPDQGVTAPPRRLVRSLLLLAIAVASGAILLSVLLGRLLIRPLEDLTGASARMGRGDLATPIARAPGAEIGSLADSMEEMRRRLLRLTGELRQRQSESEAIVTGIVEGVFGVDRERRIRYLNPQAAALLGVAPDTAIGRFCGDVLNPQGTDGVRPCEERCPIVHARFRGQARAAELLMLANGASRSVVITSADDSAASAAEGPGSTDAPRQFQVIRDETDIEATRRVRDTVLANITHEFRTPLSAQLASIELLRDRLEQLSPGEVRDLVAALERGTLRLTQLIDNLLESVRLDAGEASIRRQPVAMEAVVEEAIALTSSLIHLREQRLEVRFPEAMPSVRGDAPRLVQVFVNLLANANKFAPSGTAIRIGGDVDDHEVALWVEDEGPGITPRDGGVLFERFMRSPGEEPAESGMGLGLWIVKSIVERHGGRVEARRGDGGAGTRMCVILPFEERA